MTSNVIKVNFGKKKPADKIFDQFEAKRVEAIETINREIEQLAQVKANLDSYAQIGKESIAKLKSHQEYLQKIIDETDKVQAVLETGDINLIEQLKLEMLAERDKK